MKINLGVAQSGRALALGVRGRRFKSSHPDQKRTHKGRNDGMIKNIYFCDVCNEEVNQCDLETFEFEFGPQDCAGFRWSWGHIDVCHKCAPLVQENTKRYIASLGIVSPRARGNWWEMVK